MPKFRVNIGPGLSQIVEAQTADDARKMVKADIAKGTLAVDYDKIYFDYDTGVPIRSLRRKLARAENVFEQEAVLRNEVGSKGFTRNSKGQLALTPQGLLDLGLPYSTRTLNDGQKIAINTIIDERTFDLKSGDLADMIGIAGPVLGAIAALSPQLKVLKGLTALAGNRAWLGRLLASGVGSAGGKLTEEAADYIQGFQLQEAGDIAKLAGREFSIGLAGQAIGEGLGLGIRSVIGAKEPTSNLRLLYQMAQKRSVDDVKKLDMDLGREATEAEIKKAIEEGKIFTGFSQAFLASQAAQGRMIPARIQQIQEAVIPSVRQQPNIDYLMTETKKIGNMLNKEAADLSSLVDAGVKADIDESIEIFAKGLRDTEYEASKELVNLVDNMANALFKTGPYKGDKGALGTREFGQLFKDTLFEAEQLAIKRRGDEYDAADFIFKNLKNANEPAAQVINKVVFKKVREAKDIIKKYKDDNIAWKLGVPEEDIDASFIIRLDNILDDLEYKTYFNNVNITQIRNAISEMKKNTNSIDPQFKNRKLAQVLRKFDDSDIGGSDSILTELEKTGTRKMILQAADDGIEISPSDVNLINAAIKKLRNANRLNAELMAPFDNMVIKKIAADAKKTGAFDADEVLEKLVYKGSRKDFEDLFKALDEYDDYLTEINRGSEAITSSRAKSQIKKRLFYDAFREATDVRSRPGEINFAHFAKTLQNFERTHPGKLDVLFSDMAGDSTANLFRQTVADLRKLDPRLKANDVKELIQQFTATEGLGGSAQGRVFIEGLKRQSDEALKLERFERNINLSRLSERPVDDVVLTVFRPRNADNIEELKNILDETTFQELKDASFVRFLEDSIDFGFNGNGNVTDVFKPGNLQNALTKYGDETLEAMFGKETTQSLKQLANTIDIATKGEVGRGAGAGGIVAAGIGASILFAPMAALPTLAGLYVGRFLLSNPYTIKLFTKTDKGSIAELLDAFKTGVLQASARGLDTGTRTALEKTNPLIDQILSDPSLQEAQKEIQQIRRPSPQTQVELPEVRSVPRPQNLFPEDVEARRQFAEDLFRRPVI